MEQLYRAYVYRVAEDAVAREELADDAPDDRAAVDPDLEVDGPRLQVEGGEDVGDDVLERERQAAQDLDVVRGGHVGDCGKGGAAGQYHAGLLRELAKTDQEKARVKGPLAEATANA